ncbi:MAG: DUF11 domain-containing protein [Fuerstiella sp.]|nr:DUF11 domain-containing protein [Fuerstiella sp.]
MMKYNATSVCSESERKYEQALTGIAVAVLLFLPACSSQSRMAFVNQQQSAIVSATEANSEAQTNVRQEPDLSVVTPVDASDTLKKVELTKTQTTLAGSTRMSDWPRRDSSVRTAVSTRTSDNEVPGVKIVPMSHKVVSDVDHDPAHRFTPAEMRIDPAFGRMSPADLYPDEYLADGGDRQLPVHYFGGSRKGFDTEDTIAEYSDHNGKSHVRASNRVAVYAPRFGSVRVIEGANSDTRIHHAVQATEFSSIGSMNRRNGLRQAVKDDQFVAVSSRRRADGTEAQKNSFQSSAAIRPQRNDKVDQGLQAESIKGRRILEREQGPGFHQELANAVVWSRDLFPKLSGTTSQAAQTHRRVTAQATIGIEDQRAEKSEIHIVKLADRETAEIGDTIHFTIRFINTGDYDLHDVRIVDNLTPRLRFIPDSVQTDREGDVITEPNGEGSEVLTFVLDDRLRAHESGTIEFEVRVK